MRSFAAIPGDVNSAGLGGKQLAYHQQPLKVEVLEPPVGGTLPW